MWWHSIHGDQRVRESWQGTEQQQKGRAKGYKLGAETSSSSCVRVVKGTHLHRRQTPVEALAAFASSMKLLASASQCQHCEHQTKIACKVQEQHKDCCSSHPHSTTRQPGSGLGPKRVPACSKGWPPHHQSHLVAVHAKAQSLTRMPQKGSVSEMADRVPPTPGQPGLLPDTTHQVGDVHAQHILDGLDHAVLQLGKGGEIICPQNLAIAVDVWEVTCS